MKSGSGLNLVGVEPEVSVSPSPLCFAYRRRTTGKFSQKKFLARKLWQDDHVPRQDQATIAKQGWS